MTRDTKVRVAKGMLLRDAVRCARYFGAEVIVVRRTGEFGFLYPGLPRCKTNMRSKDCPAMVVSWLRKIERKRENQL